MIPAPPCPHRTMAGHRQLSTPLPWNSPLVIFPTPTRTRFRQRPPKCPTSRWTIPHSKATTSTIIKMQVNMNLIKGTRDSGEVNSQDPYQQYDSSDHHEIFNQQYSNASHHALDNAPTSTNGMFMQPQYPVNNQPALEGKTNPLRYDQG